MSCPTDYAQHVDGPTLGPVTPTPECLSLSWGSMAMQISMYYSDPWSRHAEALRLYPVSGSRWLNPHSFLALCRPNMATVRALLATVRLMVLSRRNASTLPPVPGSRWLDPRSCLALRPASVLLRISFFFQAPYHLSPAPDGRPLVLSGRVFKVGVCFTSCGPCAAFN